MVRPVCTQTGSAGLGGPSRGKERTSMFEGEEVSQPKKLLSGSLRLQRV